MNQVEAHEEHGRRLPRLCAAAARRSSAALDLNAWCGEVLVLYEHSARPIAAAPGRRHCRRCSGDATPAAPGDPQPAAATREDALQRRGGRREIEVATARRQRAASVWWCATTAPASRPRSWRAPSSPTSPPRRRAPAWAWRS
ncbi:MAG: hypothetical protein MZW92_76190 [Comamonadaceae bacterium]|nr:hypothetical protein [Comamonadaceae bacterium]